MMLACERDYLILLTNALNIALALNNDEAVTYTLINLQAWCRNPSEPEDFWKKTSRMEAKTMQWNDAEGLGINLIPFVTRSAIFQCYVDGHPVGSQFLVPVEDEPPPNFSEPGPLGVEIRFLKMAES